MRCGCGTKPGHVQQCGTAECRDSGKTGKVFLLTGHARSVGSAASSVILRCVAQKYSRKKGRSRMFLLEGHAYEVGPPPHTRKRVKSARIEPTRKLVKFLPAPTPCTTPYVFSNQATCWRLASASEVPHYVQDRAGMAACVQTCPNFWHVVCM